MRTIQLFIISSSVHYFHQLPFSACQLTKGKLRHTPTRSHTFICTPLADPLTLKQFPQQREVADNNVFRHGRGMICITLLPYSACAVIVLKRATSKLTLKLPGEPKTQNPPEFSMGEYMQQLFERVMLQRI